MLELFSSKIWIERSVKQNTVFEKNHGSVFAFTIKIFPANMNSKQSDTDTALLRGIFSAKDGQSRKSRDKGSISESSIFRPFL